MLSPSSDNNPQPAAAMSSPSKGWRREFSRRIAKHSLVLAFSAGVILLFIIEGALPLWLAAAGMALIAASALVYTGPLPAINPRSWRTERRYAMRRDAANLLPHPIMLMSVNGNIRLASQAASILFERENLRGLHISALVRDPDFLNAFAKTQKDGTTRNVHWQIHVPVERYFHVHIAANLVPRRGMTPFILIAFDEQTDIRRAAQMRSDFIANASHELKTPLAIFIGYLETLRNIKPQDENTRQKFITIMEEQSQTMVNLVGDLLSLSRIEQKEHLLPDENINLSNIISQAIKIHLSAAERANIKITSKNMPGQAPSKGDAQELSQAIGNLIQNAVSHGKGGKKHEVEISLTEDTLEGRPAWSIQVRDFGPGIAKHHLPRLTERFYRVHAEESRKLGGTGLGLAIVKHILTRHRGALRITSHEGEGSTFTALLPQS